MTPLDKLRIEKAAADCGFEITATSPDGDVELRSARFPESVAVRMIDAAAFEVTVSNPLMLKTASAEATVLAQGYGALYDVLAAAAARARTLPNRVADQFRRQTAGLPRATEAERLVVQRIGQDLFRAALLDYWQGRCCVTGLDILPLLRASHIKPWAACTNDDERLDVFNGLLLAPHVDALFDDGWISFSDAGAALVSDALPPPARELLQVDPAWMIPNLMPAHRHYLAFHRQHVLR